MQDDIPSAWTSVCKQAYTTHVKPAKTKGQKVRWVGATLYISGHKIDLSSTLNDKFSSATNLTTRSTTSAESSASEMQSTQDEDHTDLKSSASATKSDGTQGQDTQKKRTQREKRQKKRRDQQ